MLCFSVTVLAFGGCERRQGGKKRIEQEKGHSFMTSDVLFLPFVLWCLFLSLFHSWFYPPNNGCILCNVFSFRTRLFTIYKTSKRFSWGFLFFCSGSPIFLHNGPISFLLLFFRSAQLLPRPWLLSNPSHCFFTTLLSLVILFICHTSHLLLLPSSSRRGVLFLVSLLVAYPLSFFFSFFVKPVCVQVPYV